MSLTHGLSSHMKYCHVTRLVSVCCILRTYCPLYCIALAELYRPHERFTVNREVLVTV